MQKLVLFIISFIFLAGGTSGVIAGEWPLGNDLGPWPRFDDSSPFTDNHFGNQDRSLLDGRLTFDYPLFFPNLYVMANSFAFDASNHWNIRMFMDESEPTSQKSSASQITLTEYDLALYYDVPLVRTITADMLNIDLGLNVRAVDFEGNQTHEQFGSSSKNFIVPIPMVFGAFQFQPLHTLALEAEGRGISLGDNKAFSVIGRIRWNIADDLYAAGGYRYDKFDIDYQGVLIDADISGPFFEAGLAF